MTPVIAGRTWKIEDNLRPFNASYAIEDMSDLPECIFADKAGTVPEIGWFFFWESDDDRLKRKLNIQKER